MLKLTIMLSDSQIDKNYSSGHVVVAELYLGMALCVTPHDALSLKKKSKTGSGGCSVVTGSKKWRQPCSFYPLLTAAL